MASAIEKGITYVSADVQELSIEDPEFVRHYTTELIEGKEDILAIQSEIQTLVQGYEVLFVELEEKEQSESLEERRHMVLDGIREYENVTSTICTVLDTYVDMANMIQQMETSGGNPAYLFHRKHELLEQNVELNKIFDRVDYYISIVVDMLAKETELAKAVVEGAPGVSEEETVQILFLHQTALSSCVEINKALVERLQIMVPRLEGLREDVMKVQVHSVANDVEERRKRLQELRQQAKVEDVTDYADLEGQYRHNYDEEGNHIGTEEGGDGGNRKSLTAILVVTAIVIAIFAAYVYIK